MDKRLYNLMEYSTSFWLFKKLTEHKLKPFLGAGSIHVPHLNFRFLNFLCSGIWRSTRVISFVSNFLGPLRGLGNERTWLFIWKVRERILGLIITILISSLGEHDRRESDVFFGLKICMLGIFFGSKDLSCIFRSSNICIFLRGQSSTKYFLWSVDQKNTVIHLNPFFCNHKVDERSMLIVSQWGPVWKCGAEGRMKRHSPTYQFH